MKTLVVNRNIIMSIFVVILLIYGTQGISYGQDEALIEFADANLARAVREALGLGTGDGVDLLKIPKVELEKLTTLDASDKNIIDLTGLEHASQLTELYLDENQISDITPLAQLTQLTRLSLRENQISDVTPLAGLISLKLLRLLNNPIKSQSPLHALRDANPDVDLDITIYDYIEGPWLWMIAPGGLLNTDNLAASSEGMITETQIAQNGVSEGDHFNSLQWTSGRLLPTRVCGIFLCSSDNVINVVRQIGLTDSKQLTQYSAYALINLFSPREQKNVLMGVGSDDSIKVWLNGEVVYINDTTRRTTRIQNRFRVDLNAGNNLLLIKVCNHGSWKHSLWTTNDDWGMFFKIYLDPADYTISLPMRDSNSQQPVTSEVPEVTETPETITTETTDTTVSLIPSSVASPAVGQQIEFSLKIADGEAVAGYQASVQFDTTALRYVSGANGDFLPAGAFFVETTVKGNLVQLNAVSLAGENNGDGTLATLTFEIIALKASTLTLSDVLLTDNAGSTSVPNVENAEITDTPQLKGDVNGDGTVNIADLVLVASNLGKIGQNAADVNGDSVVNIADLVLVAGAFGTSATAPSLHAKDMSMLTAADIKQWLSQAQQLGLTDATSLRGVLFLEQLLTALTPKETALLANYPNPFNPETWIPYHLAKDAEVTLHIYAVNGTFVRTLTLGHQPAGLYQNRSRAAYWDGKNEFGEAVASGVYFYTLTASDFSTTRKMLIRK